MSRHLERLDAVSPPEMQRVPLENVYLQARTLEESLEELEAQHPAALEPRLPPKPGLRKWHC